MSKKNKKSPLPTAKELEFEVADLMEAAESETATAVGTVPVEETAPDSVALEWSHVKGTRHTAEIASEKDGKVYRITVQGDRARLTVNGELHEKAGTVYEMRELADSLAFSRKPKPSQASPRPRKGKVPKAPKTTPEGGQEAPKEKKTRTIHDGELTSKDVVYRAWLASNKEAKASELHPLVADAVKVTSVSIWLTAWRNPKDGVRDNIPARSRDWKPESAQPKKTSKKKSKVPA